MVRITDTDVKCARVLSYFLWYSHFLFPLVLLAGGGGWSAKFWVVVRLPLHYQFPNNDMETS